MHLTAINRLVGKLHCPGVYGRRQTEMQLCSYYQPAETLVPRSISGNIEVGLTICDISALVS